MCPFRTICFQISVAECNVPSCDGDDKVLSSICGNPYSQDWETIVKIVSLSYEYKLTLTVMVRLGIAPKILLIVNLIEYRLVSQDVESVMYRASSAFLSDSDWDISRW